MSKIISIICQGCSIVKQVPTQNDNHPDLIKGEWLCPKCEKKLEQLKSQKLAEAQAEQEKISNPGNCLSCQNKIKRGQYCSSCLKKTISESIEKAWKKSQELNNILENSINNSEESNNQLKEALLDYLAKLEQNNKKRKLEDIETELKENEEEIARIKKQIEENKKKKNNKNDNNNDSPFKNNPPLPTDLPNYSFLNNSPPTSSQNNQSNLKCYNCKKNFNYGDNTHYFPQNPDKKWCDACDLEIKICLDTTQKIFKNQEVNVDNLNISTENKEQLKALVKIKKGEQVDIDNLGIDQESKEELKKIQKQLSPNLPNNKPQQRSQNTSDYVVNCLNCNAEYETNKNKEPHSNCWYCKSKNIQVWKNGVLQESGFNSEQNNNSYLPWIVGGAACVVLLIFYFLWRQKKVKEMRSKDKKIPWWF